MGLNDKSVGHKIRDLRKINHMTQVKFSERIHMTQQTLSRYETGKNPVPNDVLQNIAREFGVPVSYFLGISTEDYTEDELCLLEYYRRVDNRLKERMLDLVRIMAENFVEENEQQDIVQYECFDFRG